MLRFLRGIPALLIVLATIPACAQKGDLYKVVINHEEKYSVWPTERDLLPGWKEMGVQGTAKECSNYIEEVWTDMRTLSVRE